jgi:hypothetical protein
MTVDASPECAAEGIPLLSLAQTFKITGGTGVFAGASGSGTVSRTNVNCCPGSAVDNWDGTISAPGFDVDTTAPTISGAADKVVRARRGSRFARVKYKVTAIDNLDGAVPVTCKPRSGSRFKIGRTVVKCSAIDTSANIATAEFAVIVRRR